MARKAQRYIEAKSTGLNSILEIWCDLQEKYTHFEGAVAYDQSEAANTSLLIAAANLSPCWVGLSESYVERKAKGGSSNSTDNKLARGLLDAYLSNGKTGYLIELKQVWISPLVAGEKGMTGKRDINGYVQRRMNAAKDQLEQLNYTDSFVRDDDYRLFYGAFIVPEYKEETPVSHQAAFEWMIDFCKKNPFDACAIFSPCLQDRRLIADNHQTRRPLVALVLNELDLTFSA